MTEKVIQHLESLKNEDDANNFYLDLAKSYAREVDLMYRATLSEAAYRINLENAWCKSEQS